MSTCRARRHLHQRTVAITDGGAKMRVPARETTSLNTTRRILASAWSAALLAGAAAPAHAIQFGLKDGPGAKFNNDDLALMMARVDTALKSPTEGEVLEWKNDKTPASGSVVPMNKLTSNGLSCRRLRITNVYGEQKAQGVYKFCEKPAGKWKLVGPEKE
jgi:surface antigen